MRKLGILVAALGIGLAGGRTGAQAPPTARPPAARLDDRHGHDDSAGEGRRASLGERDPSHGPPPGEGEHGRGPDADGAEEGAAVEQRAEALAGELEVAAEHLEDGLIPDGNDDRPADPRTVRLFRRTEMALVEAVRFRDLIGTGAAPQKVLSEFESLDDHVQGVLPVLLSSQNPALRRSGSRVAYADEQLRALVATGAARRPSELVPRQARVLSAEAARLERAARFDVAQIDADDVGTRRGDPELVAAIRAFSEATDRFDLTAETERDPGHLAKSFSAVDVGWRRVVELANANRLGVFVLRRAERVGTIHEEIRRALGVPGDRPVIRSDHSDGSDGGR